jgi:hypothetical protein
VPKSTMNRFLPGIALLLFSLLLLISCNTATPEKYFDLAVLNMNMIVGFAEASEVRQLDSPPATMDAAGNTISMPRKDVISSKLKYIEESLAKLQALTETPETKEMLQTSTALYEYVIPVYKNEYTELAALYDAAASKTEINEKAAAIHFKYYKHYRDLFEKLIGIGKSYAAAHSIKVNW